MPFLSRARFNLILNNETQNIYRERERERERESLFSHPSIDVCCFFPFFLFTRKTTPTKLILFQEVK